MLASRFADAVQGPAIAEMLWTWGIEAIIVIQRGDSWADGLYNIIEIDFPARGGVIAERIRCRIVSWRSTSNSSIPRASTALMLKDTLVSPPPLMSTGIDFIPTWDNIPRM